MTKGDILILGLVFISFFIFILQAGLILGKDGKDRFETIMTSLTLLAGEWGLGLILYAIFHHFK